MGCVPKGVLEAEGALLQGRWCRKQEISARGGVEPPQGLEVAPRADLPSGWAQGHLAETPGGSSLQTYILMQETLFPRGDITHGAESKQSSGRPASRRLTPQLRFLLRSARPSPPWGVSWKMI